MAPLRRSLKIQIFRDKVSMQIKEEQAHSLIIQLGLQERKLDF